jgi:hypothetical protein
MNERALLKAFFEWFLRLVLPPGRRSQWTLGPNSGVDVGFGLRGIIGAGTGQIDFAADRIHSDGRTERQRFQTNYLTGAIGIGAEIPNVTFSTEGFPSEGEIFYGLKGDDFASASDFCGECMVVQVGGGIIAGGQATTIALGLSRNTRAYVSSAVAFAEEVRHAWRNRTVTLNLLRRIVDVLRQGYALVRDGTLWRGQVRSRGAVAGLQAGVSLQVSFGVVASTNAVASVQAPSNLAAQAAVGGMLLGRAGGGVSRTFKSVRTGARS